MSSYRPLPRYLTIAESKIEGLGLYTKQNIPAAAYVGSNDGTLETRCARALVEGLLVVKHM